VNTGVGCYDSAGADRRTAPVLSKWKAPTRRGWRERLVMVLEPPGQTPATSADRPPVDEQAVARAQAAISADIPHLYVNGLVSRMSNGDVLIVLERNNTPICNRQYVVYYS
jgi:hypothetical protein